jgi:hypothetical protein
VSKKIKIQNAAGDFQRWFLIYLGMDTKMTVKAGAKWELTITGTGRGTDGFEFAVEGATLSEAITKARALGEELIK